MIVDEEFNEVLRWRTDGLLVLDDEFDDPRFNRSAVATSASSIAS